MLEPDQIVVAGAGAVIQDKAILRQIRGSIWDTIDPRFLTIAILSLAFHITVLSVLNHVKLRPPEMVRIEELPERFARLIIEKPILKETPMPAKPELAKESEKGAEKPQEKTAEAVAEKRKVEQAIAKKNVAARVARVENKIRTVGVLGILTGVGSTAKGPSVVDVLGSGGSRKERFQDLELALGKTSGLTKTESFDVLDRTLVKSKEVNVDHGEDIDEILAGVRTVTTKDLAKKGDFIIRPPESIEGAASSNAKRDDKAISAVVRTNKTSVKLTYEKYLKRDPTLAGKITVRFTISADGRVSSVEILENTMQNPAFENDIVRKIKMWHFEAIPEGDVTVTYPFIFQPS